MFLKLVTNYYRHLMFSVLRLIYILPGSLRRHRWGCSQNIIQLQVRQVEKHF